MGHMRRTRRRRRLAVQLQREIAQIDAARENVPARVSHGTLAIPFKRFRDADFAEVCAHMGLPVLT